MICEKAIKRDEIVLANGPALGYRGVLKRSNQPSKSEKKEKLYA